MSTQTPWNPRCGPLKGQGRFESREAISSIKERPFVSLSASSLSTIHDSHSFLQDNEHKNNH